MILLIVGTSSWDFTRLIKEMDHIAGEIGEEVIMQIENNNYEPKNAKYFRIISKEEIEKLYEKSRIIVSHAGIGTIISAIRHNKPIIIVPRRKDYNELFDDHQIDTARKLEKERSMKVIWDIKELERALKDITINSAVRKDKKLILALREFIDHLEG